MFDALKSVKSLVKLSSTKIDNNVFRLHYKATVIILVAFSVLTTSRQYVGDPIDCMADEIPSKVMDTYCWIYSTFTVPDRLGDRVGKDVVHPGVAPVVEGESDIKYHKYYQWVCFVLVFQALLFYTPHYIWKLWEGGRLKKLADGLDGPIVSANAEEKVRQLVLFFNKNHLVNNVYVVKFIFCEILNLVNVIGQIFFMDYFLDGEFSTYGWEVLTFTNQNPEDRHDPMARVFPKVTKCTFHKYGPSGTVQKFDGLCVLPLNIMNEKIYVFLWFWFVILSVVTGIAVLYRLATVFSAALRAKVLDISGLSEKKDIIAVNSFTTRYGDWFVLKQIGENCDPLAYKSLLKAIADSQNDKKA